VIVTDLKFTLSAPDHRSTWGVSLVCTSRCSIVNSSKHTRGGPRRPGLALISHGITLKGVAVVPPSALSISALVEGATFLKSSPA
jgi:hypothetical protein